MAQRVQKQKSEKVQEEVAEPEPQPQSKGEELKAEIDSLLDEIDGVLEQNAETFVRDYVQRGGQ